MSEYAMQEALRTYGYGRPTVVLFNHEPVACPICGKECGGKSDKMGDRGRFEGVIQHLRFKHKMKGKRARDLIAQRNEETD